MNTTNLNKRFPNSKNALFDAPLHKKMLILGSKRAKISWHTRKNRVEKANHP